MRRDYVFDLAGREVAEVHPTAGRSISPESALAIPELLGLEDSTCQQ